MITNVLRGLHLRPAFSRTLASTFVLLLFGTLTAVGQEAPATLASIESQTPKSGMVKQYEDGRKQKAAWHKQQNDPLPLYVWETISGEHTGTYLVGRLGQHWADLDKPPIPDQADVDEYNKVIGGYVQSIVTRYWELMPKVSKPTSSQEPSKFSQILTFHVRMGKEEDFRSAIDRITEAINKTNWPVNYFWYALASGGPTGTFVLVIPHSSWADFEPKPGMKPFDEMLKQAFGQAEADSITKRLDAAVETESSELIQLRPDLSYIPNK